jgi:hypothetical protein
MVGYDEGRGDEGRGDEVTGTMRSMMAGGTMRGEVQ